MKKVKLLFLFTIVILVAYGLVKKYSLNKQIQIEAIRVENFGEIIFDRPTQINGAAFIFSGPERRNYTDYKESLSNLLSAGIMVFEANPETYLNTINDPNDCSVIGAEVERLNQSLQNSLGLTEFHKAAMIGIDQGALVTYVSRFHSPDRFEGTIAYGLCPITEYNLCPTDLLIRDSENKLFKIDNFAATPNTLKDYFFVSTAKDCPNINSEQVMPKQIPLRPESESLVNQINLLIPKIIADSEANKQELTIVKAKDPQFMAIFLSGDGGWAGIDQDTGGYLAKNGVNVIGISSLKYFWHKKTPEQISALVEQLIKKYKAEWSLNKVILIGYSLGADAVPFVYNRLSDESKDSIVSVAMLAPEHETDLQVHISDWIGVETSTNNIPLLPETIKIPHKKLLCISGDDDDDGVCDELDKHIFSSQKLSGGHHFDGEYEKLGKIIKDFTLKNIGGQ